MNPKKELSSNSALINKPIKPIITPIEQLNLSMKQKEQMKKYNEGMRAYFPT
jgi:hypothetical protein